MSENYIETALHFPWASMAAMPAQLRDPAIFDLTTLDDRATYEHPTEYPTGIDWVLVNGVITIDHGTHTGANAGQALYGPGHDLALAGSAPSTCAR